jgi:hypothetical protein
LRSLADELECASPAATPVGRLARFAVGRMRERYEWWEMERLAFEIERSLREAPGAFEEREPLWVERERLRAKRGVCSQTSVTASHEPELRRTLLA